MARFKLFSEFINEKEIRTGDIVRMKNSGIIGVVTAINDVTKTIALLADDGDAIETQLEDIELIDDKIQKGLDNIEGKGKEEEKMQVVGQGG